jgi:hypothetical protein
MKIFREAKRAADAGKTDLPAPDDGPEAGPATPEQSERNIDARGEAWRHSQLRRPE